MHLANWSKNMKYIIIGYGNIGKKRYNALKEKCIATVDPNKEGVDYKDYKKVPIDSYDAAILSVPNDIKIGIMKYLLSNKKHVLVEKPLLFEDEKAAQELLSIAKDNGVIWYTSYNHRFEPLVVKLKKFLDEKTIGEVYFANLTYGNGTVKNIVNTWRDVGYGVLEDLGCHLMDIGNYLFSDNWYKREYKLNDVYNFEAKTWDFISFSSVDNHLHFLCSTLMWKNTFKIEVIGSKGSLHLNGLNKWGESKLILHERVFPSGVPKKTVTTSSGADESWKKDIEYFEKMVSDEHNSYENDLNIYQSIKSLTLKKGE
jgi:predicted dehydrogenase